MTETEYTPFILAALNRAGRQTRMWRQNAGAAPKRNKRGKVVGAIHGAPAGAADLTGYVRPEGWRLEVELKGHKTRVGQDQKRWASLVCDGGCIYVLVRIDERAVEYDDELTPEQNLKRLGEANAARHVVEIDEAIEVRRAAGEGVAAPGRLFA